MQKQATFAEALEARCPRELAVAIAREPQGKYNPIALGWMMFTSYRPPMLVISVAPQRYSCEVIRKAGEFVLALPAAHQGEEMMLYGTKSGRNCDKLALANAAVEPATEIDCVLLSEAVVNFECRLAGEMVTGDHVIFVGEVLRSLVSDPPRRRLYILGPGHRMGQAKGES